MAFKATSEEKVDMSKGEEIGICYDTNSVVSNSVSRGGSCRVCRNADAHERLLTNDEIMIETIEKSDKDETNFVLSHPLVVHLLVVVFGVSAWIGVNGIYVQLPLLVATAPEAWNLAAYLVVIIQAANIGPAAYTLARKFYPTLNESLCIFGLLLTGSLSMGILAFLYDRTSYIGDAEHSVTLFVCAFFTALVGCTSSVLFMPYLRNCSEKYLTSYFIGEGLSGVLPSVVAFFQGVGGNSECRDSGNGTLVEVSSPPRFSPRDYFIFIFSVLLLSLCTFVILQYLPSIRSKNSSQAQSNNSCSRDEKEQKCERSENNVCCAKNATIDNNLYRSSTYDLSANSQIVIDDRERDISLTRTVYFHILVGLVCFLGNGFLPGIQTYSCLPYGNVAFHLTVTLANIANPTACLLYLWINSVNFKILDGLSFVGVLTCTYAIYLAAMSPTPPLRDTVGGATIAVLAWILLTGVISYLKISITSIVRQKIGSKALLGVGIVMQLGSACGALVSFGLINYTTSFHQHKPCSTL